MKTLILPTIKPNPKRHKPSNHINPQLQPINQKNSKQRKILGNKEIVWGKKQKEKESARTSETHPCIGVQWEANVQGSESNKTNKQRRLKCRVAIQVQLVQINSLMIYL